MKRDFFQTVTFRLALWCGVLFLLVGLLIFISTYVVLNSNLRRLLDQELLIETKELENIYQGQPLPIFEEVLVKEAESEGIERMFCRLITPDGSVIISSDMTYWEPVLEDLNAFHVIRDTMVFYKTVRPTDDTYSARVISRKISGDNIIQIGIKLSEYEYLLKNYRKLFWATLTVLLVCGCTVGWYISRKAMFGVERVTQTAFSIGRENITQRVPPGKEGREISNLVDAFNNMLERIQALVEELKDVTNSIAHDIRSPLTRIRGVAETTLTGQPSLEEYQDMAVMVIDECDRLTEMINTMLEIAQTDSGIAQLSRTSLDLVELACDAYELFSAVAEDKNLSFTFDPREEKIEIFGDRSRLQRAIANIVDNALKYTPHDGSVNITVWQDSSHAVLTVIDSGSGITEQDLPHIFDRFFRSDSSRSTPGNGLGLSLAQSIIKAHGGEISVTSAPGVGSTFTVLLRK